MSNFKRYDKYRDSDIEWIGEIPEGWKAIPLKRIFKIINGGTPNSSEESYWNGEIVWITPNDLSELTEIYIRDSERKITEDGINNCSAKIVPKDSIIISTRAPIGYVAIAGVDLCTNQGCKSLVPVSEINSKFFYYFILSINFYLNILGQGTTFMELSNSNLSMVELLKPPIDEQISIANFLDQKTAEIDDLIADKEKLIELLQEKRQAVITEAVTKGLNPNVKMKDSGIEWIGKIPEGWKVTKVKYFYDICLGKMIQPNQKSYSETLEYYLCSLNVTWDGIDTSNLKEMWFSKDEKNRYSLRSGDLIVCEGGDAGRASIWDGSIENCYIQNAVHRVREKKNSSNKYLYYWLYFLKHSGYIDLICNKATITHYTYEKFSNTILIIPDLSEQYEIINYLDKKILEINLIKKEIQEQIQKLREYRQSLIFEAVTGKIDVRDYASIS